VTAEYLRRGRPVIGARSGGTRELIDDGVTGLLYEPRNCKALAEHMETFAGSNAVLIRLSNAALERSADRFVLDEYLRELRGVLTRAAQSPNSSCSSRSSA
jgi:glycosyltransferase involved in cell wall biosynthesis